MTLHDPAPGASLNAAPFVILRRTGLYVGLTVATFLIAAGFGTLAFLRDDWMLVIPAAFFVALGLITLPGVGDARTPLFVADDHGVRMRHQHGWIGLLWSELGEIRVEPSRGPAARRPRQGHQPRRVAHLRRPGGIRDKRLTGRGGGPVGAATLGCRILNRPFSSAIGASWSRLCRPATSTSRTR